MLERGDSNGEVKWDMIFRSLDSLKCNLDKEGPAPASLFIEEVFKETTDSRAL